MYNKKSDYALNKMNPDAIVYIDAEGKVVRLTKEDFTSEEEFQRWKEWSDENYHVIEKKQHVESNHTVPLNAAMEATTGQHDSEKSQNVDERTLLLMCKNRMTDKQFRRYWLYRIEKLTEEEIAAREGVSHQGISKSLKSAEKIFVNFLKTRLQNDL